MNGVIYGHTPDCALAAAIAPQRPSGVVVDETPTSAGSASDDKGIVSAERDAEVRRAAETADFVRQLREARVMLADPDVDNWTKLKICEAVDVVKAAVDAALARRALAAQGAGREGDGAAEGGGA